MGKKRRGNGRKTGAVEKLVYAAAAAMFILLVAVCTFVGAADRLLYTEQFVTGKVGISIREMDGKRGANELLTAGKTMEYSPGILCRDADCYVRARIGITSDKGPLEGGAEAYIRNLDRDWVKRGDYYYCKKIMSKGDYETIFSGVKIPDGWTNETAVPVTVDIKAEAIQSRNFRPDFGAAMPWGAVMLADAAAGENAALAEPVTETSEVSFDSTGRFECNTADLFDLLPEVMPADRYKKVISVTNISGENMEISLKVHADDSFINNKMIVQVEDESGILFRGSAVEAGKHGIISTGRLHGAEQKNISVTLELPADTINEYMDISDSVMWEIAADIPDDGGVQSGDDRELIKYIVTALLAAVLMLSLMLRKRKGLR